MIMPVQCVRVMSSSFSRPHEMVPSPTPFWPCSSSSSRRKLRGTTAEEMGSESRKSINIFIVRRSFNWLEMEWAVIGGGGWTGEVIFKVAAKESATVIVVLISGFVFLWQYWGGDDEGGLYSGY